MELVRILKKIARIIIDLMLKGTGRRLLQEILLYRKTRNHLCRVSAVQKYQPPWTRAMNMVIKMKIREVSRILG